MTPTRATNAPPDLLIEPDAASAAARAKSFHQSRVRDDVAAATRRELGLPLDRPIIMTGHQVAWWHAGILAKYMACEAVARCIGGAAIWVTPDQDESDYPEIAAPVRDEKGQLKRERISLVNQSGAPRPPAASAPVIRDLDALSGVSVAMPSVRNGLERMRTALRAHADEPSAAKQVSAALTDLMAPHVEAAPVVFASELHHTTRFNAIIDRLRDDAENATRLYNDAAASLPEARVAPLMRTPARDRYELPLWRLETGAPRRTVFAHEIDSIPREQLAPKALLFTGFLRLAACDLFIHGTGGAVYDRVTERWLRDWLGAELAPILVVTATRRLALESDAPTPADIQHAVWKAHHARHHPGALGLSRLQEERDSIVRDIRRRRDAKQDAAPAFRRLHELLHRYRIEHQDALEELQREARAMQERSEEAAIAADRTWPFFFHDDATLTELSDRIDASVRPSAAPIA